MSWPSLSPLRSLSALVRVKQQSPASVEQASDVAKHVDRELRRWRTSIVPVEDPRTVGDRRAKTLSTIGAAMRQAQLERQRVHQQRRWRYALSAAAVLLGLGGAVYAGAGYYTPGSAVATQAVLTGQSGRVWVGALSSSELVRQPPLGEGASHALGVGDRVITHAGGEADLDVGTDTQVQLHQQSELVLARNDPFEKRLELSQGVIDVRVEPAQSARAGERGVDHGIEWKHGEHAANSKRTIVVQTPDATVVVH
ncbi:MAG TPA: hypothetical protein VFU02_16020, partial [Polyangiaceae bacterium]|nr:hypothetical protein [Polyangiaceae bacterium]